MSHPREPFERLFNSFNDCFARSAEQFGFIFDKEPGHIRRSLRLANDPLKRGVFLELKDHILEADPVNPRVVLAYGAWFYPKPNTLPFYFLSKVFYEGGLVDLQPCVEEKLKLAIIEIKSVSQEFVIHEGKLFTE